ncbi:protein TIC 20-II, chloroplastic-like [Elaeis guineensis]|uniref:Protein TIC 20 n=1 Tax=Elaeis guineensis var. tenera TaxID=51953 RepID=A0A6I9RQC4_ELAGV|nr:protein TIC 20-II, chloroplastic-like [Elaeis guineensis]
MATFSLLRFSPLPPLQTLPKSRPLLPSPTVQIPLLLKSTAAIRSIPRSNTISASYRPAVPASNRLLAALAYSLPFLNSLHYARFLFARFPAAAAAAAPLVPLVTAYRAIPYASFVAFFALYLGVVRNPAFDRFVRFNSMQAVVLDVLLVLPVLVQRVVGVPSRGLGFRLLVLGYDAIFIFSAACFFYSLANCILGRTPYLPLVAAAADRQL